MDELIEAAVKPSDQQVEEWLKNLDAQISCYEQRFRLSSLDMVRLVESGKMAETDDVCHWLILFGKRKRFESRQIKA